MSYAAFETSVHAGEPVELLWFRSGLSEWRYTSGDIEVTHLSKVFEPAGFSREEVKQSAEIAKGRIDLKTPRDTPVIGDLIASPVQVPMTLEILRRHRADSEISTVWKGRVLGLSLADHEATLTCEPIFSSLKRVGLRRPVQRQCPHSLFDAACGALKSTHQTTGTAINVSGTTVVSGVFATQANGWWVGGMIRFGDAWRTILSHTGDTISLTSAVPGVAGGAEFEVYAGCDHTPATCAAKFDNIANYGGMPWLPLKNPFTGDSAF